SLIVLFGFAAVAAQQCPNAKMSDADRSTIVEQHNRLRSELAFGRAKTVDGGFAPSGKNIYKMTWDCGLEDRSQQWADRCTFAHSSSDFRQGAGENIYQFSTTGRIPSTKNLVVDAGRAWWEELAKYGISNVDNILTREVFSDGVGHFTQMAWGATTKIGCGIATNCGKRGRNVIIVVCQYLEAGNYIDEPIYELGKPCVKDFECTTFKNSTCSAADGLCIKPQL
uniref:SCP domain-containing protein n=1 Tax=Parascaris univalens TaxID=6257 RepID=A0A915AA53_PARUN